MKRYLKRNICAIVERNKQNNIFADNMIVYILYEHIELIWDTKMKKNINIQRKTVYLHISKNEWTQKFNNVIEITIT